MYVDATLIPLSYTLIKTIGNLPQDNPITVEKTILHPTSRDTQKFCLREEHNGKDLFITCVTYEILYIQNKLCASVGQIYKMVWWLSP